MGIAEDKVSTAATRDYRGEFPFPGLAGIRRCHVLDCTVRTVRVLLSDVVSCVVRSTESCSCAVLYCTYSYVQYST